MSSERSRRAKEIFVEAARLEPAERDPFLDAACGNDVALRDEVASLLGFHDTSDGGSTPSWARLQEEPDDRVESYRLLEKLGDGGMGVVWEAEQEHPVRRRVALKLVRWGMDTREVLARFETELQAMALMDHRAIARIYAAGATERGRPFFAMELVRGCPITRYCDGRKLSINERLELFIEVCLGVQHAHHKGVIHRDLKPSNILVGDHDGRATPKIIDFGIARAAGGPGLESRDVTRLGEWVGTPEYMSPEQAALDRRDVDTRSDVYSLGVVLYELLTGAVPFELGERDGGLDEIRRRIREQDPPRPSTRVRTSVRSPGVAADRGCASPRVLVRSLRRDLDWIVMRALEKDRDRRYGSAGELAADIRRFLREEPVLAGPPTAAYRLGKAIRRNRVVATAAALVLLALLGGVAGTSVGMLRAKREAAAARQVAGALEAVLAGADPGSPFGQTSSPRELLDRGVVQISTRLATRPLVQARLLNTVAWGYRNLGLYDQAREAADRALALHRQYARGDDAALAAMLRTSGWIAFDMARYADALAAHQEARRILEAAPRPDPGALAETVGALAHALWRVGDLSAAQELHAEARRLFDEAGETDSRRLATELLLQGQLFAELDRREDARENFEGARTILVARLGEDHMEVGWALLNLGIVTTSLQAGDARALFAKAVAIQERALGADHPALPDFLSWLGYALLVAGQTEEAAAHAQRAVEVAREVLPPRHPTLAHALYFQGVLLRNTGHPEAALGFLRESLAIREPLFGPDHPLVGWCCNGIGLSCRDLGDMDTAKRYLARAVAIMERVYGPAHRSTALVEANYGYLLVRRGEAGAAREYLSRARAEQLARRGPDDDYTLHYTYLLACAEALAGDAESALDHLEVLVEHAYELEEIAKDPDFAALKGHPRFEAMLERILARRGPAPE